MTKKRFENITIGADPELFLQNPNDGGFVSAHKWVKGTKADPWPVDKGAIQLDGTAAEFNIWPCTEVNEWVQNIRTVMQELTVMTRDSGYVLSASPVADFDPVYFDQHVPNSCKSLGCDPDYDAWRMCVNDPPDGRRTFRTGAGHIHVGWGTGFDTYSPEHFELAATVARQLDYHLGIFSVLWDKDNRRRQLYGKAGAFRPKSYGVEYRVLSNAWLKTEMLQRWVFTATQLAMDNLNAGLDFFEIYGDYAKDVINDNDHTWIIDPAGPNIDNLPLPPGVLAA